MLKCNFQMRILLASMLCLALSIVFSCRPLIPQSRANYLYHNLILKGDSIGNLRCSRERLCISYSKSLDDFQSSDSCLIIVCDDKNISCELYKYNNKTSDIPRDYLLLKYFFASNEGKWTLSKKLSSKNIDIKKSIDKELRSAYTYQFAKLSTNVDCYLIFYQGKSQFIIDQSRKFNLNKRIMSLF